MFSFRSDKTGFFVTIILLALLAAAVILTVVAFVLGWEEHKWLMKVVWGTWWVLCIITVLIRLAVFRWQMIRAAQQNPPTDAGPATTQRTDSGPTTGSAGG
jgi:divalent metal cation (Fe/Co/Zn/Cd) transporter